MRPKQVVVESIVFDNLGQLVRWILDPQCVDSPTGYYGPRRIAKDLAERLLKHPSLEAFAHIEVIEITKGDKIYSLWTRKDWMDGEPHRRKLDEEAQAFRAQSNWTHAAYKRVETAFFRLNPKIPPHIGKTLIQFYLSSWQSNPKDRLANEFLHKLGFFDEPHPIAHHD